MLLNCDVGKDSWESLGQQGDQISQKGNQPWIFIGKTDAEAEAATLWPPDAKSRLVGKDPDAGKDWRQEEKGTTEDEMVGWHHQLDGHEFEQAPGASKGQGSLVCCSPWGRKESHMTYGLNNNKLVNTLGGQLGNTQLPLAGSGAWRFSASLPRPLVPQGCWRGAAPLCTRLPGTHFLLFLNFPFQSWEFLLKFLFLARRESALMETLVLGPTWSKSA